MSTKTQNTRFQRRKETCKKKLKTSIQRSKKHVYKVETYTSTKTSKQRCKRHVYNYSTDRKKDTKDTSRNTQNTLVQRYQNTLEKRYQKDTCTKAQVHMYRDTKDTSTTTQKTPLQRHKRHVYKDTRK